MSYYNIRNKELSKLYFDITKFYTLKYGKYDRLTILNIVVNSETSRLFISEKKAIFFLNSMKYGKIDNKKIKNKRELYEYLYEEYVRIIMHNPYITIKEAVKEIINKTAPKFFMNERTAYQLICKRLKNKKP